MTGSPERRAALRTVRLALAREKGHPDGDASIGYDLVMPLRGDGRLDPEEWARNRAACRVRSFGPDGDRVGMLRRKPGGSWVIDCEGGGVRKGFRFNDELFVPGEYVSIGSADAMHTFKVVSVEEA